MNNYTKHEKQAYIWRYKTMQINEIPTFKILNNEQIFKMLNALDDNSPDRSALMDYMKEYVQFPQDIRYALSYVLSLVESSEGSFYSAYGRLAGEFYLRPKVPPLYLPFRFVGWAGVHNDVGAAYEMANSHFVHGTRFFYTDDDIENSSTEAEWLAERIARESSGLFDVRVERLPEVKCGNDGDGCERFGVTFSISPENSRSILVNGNPYQSVYEGIDRPIVFVLAKAGEFNCMMGEMVNGDPDACFVLAKHMFCMK